MNSKWANLAHVLELVMTCIFTFPVSDVKANNTFSSKILCSCMEYRKDSCDCQLLQVHDMF